MKKFFLGLIGLVTLVSCNRDDNKEDIINTLPTPTPILLISKEVQNPDGAVWKFQTSYEDDKITQELNTTTGDKTLFIYDRDKIVKLVTKDTTLDFTYDNEGKLAKKIVTLNSGVQVEEIYTHESKNRINAVRNVGGQKYDVIYNLDNDGDVTNIYTTNDDLTFISNHYYRYDAPFYNPYNNIKGLHSLMLPLSPKKSLKSFLLETTTSYNGNSHTDALSITYNYKYNDNLYPIYVDIHNSKTGDSKEFYRYNQ